MPCWSNRLLRVNVASKRADAIVHVDGRTVPGFVNVAHVVNVLSRLLSEDLVDDPLHALDRCPVCRVLHESSDVVYERAQLEN